MTLTVLESNQPLNFQWEDLLRYHGGEFPGGVAHAYKAMEAMLALTGPLERRQIQILTAFPGPGARDAFELVTRAITGDRYRVDLDAGPSSAPRSAKGCYYFRWDCPNISVEAQLKPGMVRDDFIELSRKTDRSVDEEARLTELKQEMADRLMALPGDAVYTATLVQR